MNPSTNASRVTTTRKVFSTIVVLGLLAGMLIGAPAEAKKKKKKKRVERTVEAPYESPVPGVAGLASLCSPPQGCANFPVTSSEKFIAVAIEDTTGQPVYFSMSQDTDGDGVGNIFATGCGTTPEPVPITAGLELRISVYAGFGPEPPCPSPATNGTMKATFSNLP